ncbi:MAG: aspartate--ammonia ligase [Clostridia bacterium]|nr:aspartate--ammonia ligase [Clostridia bacterium]
MSKTVIPSGYRSALSLYETQIAIGKIKEAFSSELSKALNLVRVSAPLFVDPKTGLNDDLNGIERPVVFDIADTKEDAAVVHSLAKWKRMALGKYGFSAGEGIWTDMNAIRRDEALDNIHSVYTDQWDWEKIITKDQRNVEYLKQTVRDIVKAVANTNRMLKQEFRQIKTELSEEVSFTTSQELEDIYPALSPKERENAYVKEHGTTFIMQIGKTLKSGKKHDGRAPDYDDWELNGDILVWNSVLGEALEISSMGIRVDAESLDRQLTLANAENRRALPFHRMLLENKLPLTMGGGIGQSRLCMFLLGKAHIGEVQVSVWDKETQRICAENGVELL